MNEDCLSSRSPFPFDLQIQKMSRAGNAGIVATDDPFTGQRHLLIGKMQQAWHELAQVLFDTRLVLRGRWNDLGFTNHAITIYLVPMIENPSRRFRTSH